MIIFPIKLIGQLRLFLENKPVEMIAKYTLGQVEFSKFMTDAELIDFDEKLTLWSNDDHISKVKVNGIRFGDILQQVLQVLQDIKLMRIDPESYINKTILTFGDGPIIGLKEFLKYARGNNFPNPNINYLHINFHISQNSLFFVKQFTFFIDILIRFPISILIHILLTDFNSDQGIIPIDIEIFKQLAKYLSSGKIAKGLGLNLSKVCLVDEGLYLLSRSIMTGNTVDNLYIDIGNNTITDQGVLYLAEAVKSGCAKRGLWLRFPDLSDNAVMHLSNAIKSGQAPRDLIIHIGAFLSHRPCFSNQGALEIAKAIQSGAPENFSFSTSGLSDVAAASICKALNKKSSSRLHLQLNCTEDGLNSSVGPVISKKMKKNKLPAHLILEFNQVYHNINAFLNLLTATITANNSIPSIQIMLGYFAIRNGSHDVLDNFLESLRTAKYLGYFKINLITIIGYNIPLQRKLADILLSNTALIIGEKYTDMAYVKACVIMNPERYDRNSMRAIFACSKRNELLTKYPTHANYIKMLFAQSGYYKTNALSGPISPPSLEVLSIHRLFASQTNLTEVDRSVINAIKSVANLSREIDCIYQDAQQTLSN